MAPLINALPTIQQIVLPRAGNGVKIHQQQLRHIAHQTCQPAGVVLIQITNVLLTTNRLVRPKVANGVKILVVLAAGAAQTQVTPAHLMMKQVVKLLAAVFGVSTHPAPTIRGVHIMDPPVLTHQLKQQHQLPQQLQEAQPQLQNKANVQPVAANGVKILTE